MDNSDTQKPGEDSGERPSETVRQVDAETKRTPRKVDGPFLGMIGVGLASLGLVIFTIVSLVGSGSSPLSGDSAERSGSPSLGPGPTASPPRLPPAQVDSNTVIAGTVIDASGAPVAGVSVTVQVEQLAADSNPGGGLIIGGGAVETTTDDSGRFALANIDPGIVRLEMSSDQIADAQVRFITAPNLSLEIAVTRLIEIRGHVGGELLDGSGGYFGGSVTVVARLSGTTGPDLRAPLGSDNTFSLLGLAEGIYQVWLEGPELGSKAATVSALGLGPFAEVALLGTRTPLVNGLVIDRERGTAVAATISVLSSDGEPDRITLTDANGRFTLPGILAGRWTASAAASPFVAVEQLVFEGDRSRELRLSVSRGGAIDGVVVDDAGTPVAKADIDLRRDESAATPRAVAIRQQHSLARPKDPLFISVGELGVLRGPIPYPPSNASATGASDVRDRRVAQPISADTPSTTDPDQPVPDLPNERSTDAAGQFRIAGLSAGTYTLIARHPDYAGSISKTVKVRLGQTSEGLRLVVRRGIKLEGAVRGPEGPIGFAQVSSISKNQPPLSVLTDASGNYSLGPLIGAVTLEASADGFAPERRTIAVGADGTVRQADFSLEAADKTVIGRLVDSSGFPVRGARVTLQTDRSKSTATDRDGRFSLEKLAGGTHRLVLSHNDFPVVEVVATANGDETEHKLAIGGGIVGRVRDAQTGTSISGATLEIRGKDRKSQLTNTDGSGRFRFAPITHGKWMLTVRAPTYAVVSQEVDVRQGGQPGEVTVRGLQLELSLGASVSGTVRDQNGGRLAGAAVKIGKRQARTDVDGNFKVIQVASGDSVAVVATWKSAAGTHKVARTINLDAGDSKTGVELQIRIEN